MIKEKDKTNIINIILSRFIYIMVKYNSLNGEIILQNEKIKR